MATQSENESLRNKVVGRFLGLFSNMEPGESGTALLMLFNLLLLLCGYYILKTVREPLVFATGGAEMKSYAAGAQAVVLMAFIPLYSWFAGRVGRRRLIIGVVIFFIVTLELFFVGGLLKVPYLGFMFYVWVGIFSLSMIAQFWSLANDMYSESAGKRLFPVIAIGAAAGSPLGSKIAELLFKAGMSPYLMMQITAGILIVHLALSLVTERRKQAPSEKAQIEDKDESLEGSNGFALVFRNPYIRLIGLVVILANLVNTTGEYILGKTVEQAANKTVVLSAVEAGDKAVNRAALNAALNVVNEADFKATDELAVEATAEAALKAIHSAQPFDSEAFDRAFRGTFKDAFKSTWGAFIGGFYGNFFSYVNMITLLIQAFLVSRIVKYLGVKGVLFALPFVAFGAYGIIAFGAGFAAIRAMKMAENSTDYSVMNTAKALIWLPTSREEKYKAKQTVDTFLVRAGDVLSAGFVFVGTTLFQLGIKRFAAANLFLIALWVAITLLLLKEYRRVSTDTD